MALEHQTRGATSDPAIADPKHFRVVSETPKVRVLRLRFGPHEKSVMHWHPAMIVVLLADCHLRYTYQDGTSAEVIAKRGQVLDFPEAVHRLENLSDRRFEAVRIELKEGKGAR